MGHKFERGQDEILSCVESVGPTHKNALVLSQQVLPLTWKDDDLGFLSMDFKSFYIQPRFRRVLCRRVNPASSVHASPTGAQRHRRSDVVEAASARVSRLGPND